jgi:hypothetical protein
MDTREQQPHYATQALFSIRRITVRGREVGVAQLCDTIADMQALNPSGDAELKHALLGYNLSNPEEFTLASDNKLFVTKCPEFVADLVAILERKL